MKGNLQRSWDTTYRAQEAFEREVPHPVTLCVFESGLSRGSDVDPLLLSMEVVRFSRLDRYSIQ